MYRVPKIVLPLKGMPYLTFIVLVYSLAATFLIPIIPIYIKNFGLSNASVGYVTAFVSVLLLVYSLLAKKILSKIKKLYLMRIGFLGSSITLFILTLLTNVRQFLFLEIFRTFFLVAIYVTIGLFVREYTTRKAIGKAEGLYFSVVNIGYLIGPLLGGLLATAYSFETVFILAGIIQLILVLLLFLIPLKEQAVSYRHDFRILDYFKERELVKLYLCSFGLTAWWVILYTYLPLFANTYGFSERLVGYALFAAVIPLIFLEVPVGKLADLHGFKKYIALGFFIIAFFTFFTYFANSLWTIIILVIATLGAAFIEPLVEAYFFKEVKSKEKESSLYPTYKTAADVSHLISPLIFSTILIYFDFRGVFIFVVFFMLLFAFITLSLKR